MLNLDSFKEQSKDILNRIWGLKKESHRFRIIFYHSVHPSCFLSHRPDQFKEHLDWLQDNHYNTVRVRDIPKIVKSDDDLNKIVAITFDDGYRDNIEWAMPMLKERGMIATFYVVAGLIGDNPLSSSNGYRLYTNRPMLAKNDLISLVENGMEVGCHSLTHNLATRMIKERGEHHFYNHEALNSKNILEEIIKDEVLSFSYPNGQRNAFSAKSRELIFKAGYTTATTTMWDVITKHTDRLSLPRCEIAATDKFNDFVAKMLGKQDYRKIICKFRGGTKNWWG